MYTETNDGSPISFEAAAPPAESADVEIPRLAPRQKQVLARLMQGESEKQIAQTLGLSPHTVHVYIRTVYRTFNVNSRGELLALMLRSPRWSQRLNEPAIPVEQSTDDRDDPASQICRLGADAVIRQISMTTLSPEKLNGCAVVLRKLAAAAVAMRRLNH